MFGGGQAALIGLGLRPIRGELLQVPHILRQAGVAEHLPHRLHLADVIPVMVDHAQQSRAQGLADRLAVKQQFCLERLGGQALKERIGGLGDLAPYPK